MAVNLKKKNLIKKNINHIINPCIMHYTCICMQFDLLFNRLDKSNPM